MEPSALRRKDTTKGPPLRILSLDGGGVRGYSMLILLQELMYRTYVEIEGKAPKRDQIPKPCDHFDLIAGTGTGGLIAIMLGRLRLDIETCKDVYVRMTKRVFETDKTIAGIPYRSTLFKASRLEWAIQDCVREHTVSRDEGNDGSNPRNGPFNSLQPVGGYDRPDSRRLSRSNSSNASGMSSARPSATAMRWGNPNALLYDIRDNRTKTAVAAVYKGTPMNGSSALLRSYDSRKEPPPEFACTVWQAGRATSATGLAFKPIQIGQSVFHDEGAGKYNPAPQILDEAAVNEYPGREVGVFVSIGTGKRPGGTNHQQSLWWEGFVSGGMGDFAEARRRLIAKIEGCESTHQFMLQEHLSRRQVNPENYYRLNVEVGVGEFGMNEWNRLADISTSTRRYLAKTEVQRINVDAAAKMARIHRAKIRHAAITSGRVPDRAEGNGISDDIPPPMDPLAVELPAADGREYAGWQRPEPQVPMPHSHPYITSQDKFSVISSDEYPQPANTANPPRLSGEMSSHRPSTEYPTRSSIGSFIPTPRRSGEGNDGGRPSPPPLPPKTPLPYPDDPTEPPRRNPARLLNGQLETKLPYPDTDGPPPVINLARKPEYGGR